MLFPRILKNKKISLGFTLAETLIALMILATISTYTIPKILTNYQNGTKKAIFKEFFGTYSSVLSNCLATGNNATPLTYYDYVSQNMNWVKSCTNGLTQGCWIHTMTGSAFDFRMENSFILPSGVTVASINSVSLVGSDVFIMDWNGDANPNIVGEDQLLLIACYNKKYNLGLEADCNGRQGHVSVATQAVFFTNAAYQTANTNLYNSLF